VKEAYVNYEIKSRETICELLGSRRRREVKGGRKLI